MQGQRLIEVDIGRNVKARKALIADAEPVRARCAVEQADGVESVSYWVMIESCRTGSDRRAKE